MKTKTSFGKFADLWDTKVGEDGSKIPALNLQIPIFFDMLGKLKGKKVYDIACGNGFLARLLAKKGATVTASDVSPELIEIAQTKYNNKGITYEVREATDIKGLPKNHFDAVVINQGIFYIEDLNALFKNIRAILKPQGVLVFNISHPLITTFFYDTAGKHTVAKVDMVKMAKLYTTSRVEMVSKLWRGPKKKATKFWQYKRPISTYINYATRNGLYITQVSEPKSAFMKKGKVKTSPIPSIFIIKAVKIPDAN